MSVDAADQCLRLRSLIEGQVVRHLVEQKSGNRQQLLADAQQANVAVGEAETVEALMGAETRFHCVLPEGLCLDEHAQSIRAYSDKLHLFRTQVAEGSTAIENNEGRAFAHEHHAILEAVAGGDVRRARAVLDSHGEQIRERLEELASVVA